MVCLFDCLAVSIFCWQCDILHQQKEKILFDNRENKKPQGTICTRDYLCHPATYVIDWLYNVSIRTLIGTS